MAKANKQEAKDGRRIGMLRHSPRTDLKQALLTEDGMWRASVAFDASVGKVQKLCQSRIGAAEGD